MVITLSVLLYTSETCTLTRDLTSRIEAVEISYTRHSENHTKNINIHSEHIKQDYPKSAKLVWIISSTKRMPNYQATVFLFNQGAEVLNVLGSAWAISCRLGYRSPINQYLFGIPNQFFPTKILMMMVRYDISSTYRIFKK